jgi:hypothetical protein
MGTPLRSGSARVTRALDLVGATASLACVVHCAAVALVLGLMPAMSFLAAPWIEWGFLALSIGVGLAALVPGFRRHRQRSPLLLFVTGITLLITLRLSDAHAAPSEVVVVATAGVALVTAHWQNRSALQRCACGPAHHA